MLNINKYADGICIDQLMLGIGEVWYFLLKTSVFRQTDDISMIGDEYQCMFCLWLLCVLCVS